MNTKKEIVKFLEELAIGVQGKRDHEEKRLKEIAFHNVCDCGNDIGLLEAQAIFEHTKGQLYEINYILSTITRDQRKNI